MDPLRRSGVKDTTSIRAWAGLDRTVFHDFIRRDIPMRKAHNINTLRRAHYPSRLAVAVMADELSLRVVDEADPEYHGFQDGSDMQPPDIPERGNGLRSGTKAGLPTTWRVTRATNEDPAWGAAYADREMVLPTSYAVVIWRRGMDEVLNSRTARIRRRPA